MTMCNSRVILNSLRTFRENWNARKMLYAFHTGKCQCLLKIFVLYSYLRFSFLHFKYLVLNIKLRFFKLFDSCFGGCSFFFLFNRQNYAIQIFGRFLQSANRFIKFTDKQGAQSDLILGLGNYTKIILGQFESNFCRTFCCKYSKSFIIYQHKK